jgi:uncharacterized circularly permuted ATP-grasp superfamily protein
MSEMSPPLAGFDIKRPPKNHYIAPIEGRISGRIVHWMARNGKTPVFPGSLGSVFIDEPSLNGKKGGVGKWTWVVSKNPKDVEQIIENSSKQ